MTVLIEDEQEYQLPFDPQAVAEMVVEAVLDDIAADDADASRIPAASGEPADENS